MDDRPPRYADCGLLRCSAGYHVFPVHQNHTEEGEKAGRENEKRNVIKNLHKLNIPIEQIAQAVELTEKEIEEIFEGKTTSIEEFFKNLKEEVEEYYKA